MFGKHGDGDLVDREAAVLMRFGVFPDFGATGDAVAVRDAEDAALQVQVGPVQCVQLAAACPVWTPGLNPSSGPAACPVNCLIFGISRLSFFR